MKANYCPNVIYHDAHLYCDLINADHDRYDAERAVFSFIHARSLSLIIKVKLDIRLHHAKKILRNKT